MKLFVFFFFIGLFSIWAKAEEVVAIDTDNSSLIYTINHSNQLIFCYYGQKIDDKEAFSLIESYNKVDTNRDLSYEAYPTYGLGFSNEPALTIIHESGALITELEVSEIRTISKDSLINHIVILLKDRVYNFEIELHLEAYKKEDVINQWIVAHNYESKAIRIGNIYSSFLHFYADKYYLMHFTGSWANEMNLVEEELRSGKKVIESKKGVRTTQTENPSFILSLNHSAEENEGECYGGALAWSGNYRIIFEKDEWNHLNVLSGVNPFLSEYTLKTGEQLETPKMIFSYSSRGLGQLSRNFHNWGRKYALVDGFSPRPIVLNSWEGTYFDFNEKKLTRMMNNAAKIGVEMFVLDDGWFGNKYPRNSDSAGLGDWETNEKKLPHGIDYLIDYAHSKGLKFGIWIEPEMVNPKSVLAEKHPEWIVQSPGREKITLRNQLLLDLTNPEVQDFIYNTIDSLLTVNAGISYLKWDANRHVEQVGSTYLPNDQQMHFWVDYTKGLYNIYRKIRSKYPELIMQVCASGGGRIDFGSLKYHQEFWTSDNTDPLKRLFIQYGVNLIYPPVATASHVSASPNHQTGRITPLKFRFDVAMTGRLGMELQPDHLEEQEVEFAKSAIKTYKKYIRPLITEGDLYRIVSPYDENKWVALMYVSKDKSQAILFAFSTGVHARDVYPILKLNGLNPTRKYKIEEINRINTSSFWGNEKVFSGEFLINNGMEIRISRLFDSAVFKLTEVTK